MAQRAAVQLSKEVCITRGRSKGLQPAVVGDGGSSSKEALGRAQERVDRCPETGHSFNQRRK